MYRQTASQPAVQSCTETGVQTDRQTDTHSQDLLAGAPQQDGAGLGVFTFCDEGEILVTDLLHLKETGSRPHVFLTQLICSAGDTSAARPESESESERERERDRVTLYTHALTERQGYPIYTHPDRETGLPR